MSRQIYCGNNLYDLGNKRIGTPYECLRKGIGKGLNSDLTGFNPNYQAIIPDNTYCGTGRPPAGKRRGTPTSCLRKGLGIGKKLQYERGDDGDQLIEHFEHIPQYHSQQEALRGDDGGQLIEHFEHIPQYHSQQEALRDRRSPAGLVPSGLAIEDRRRASPARPLARQDFELPRWRAFLMRWWPVIVALLVGVVAAIFRATYTTIFLTMIAVLVISWLVQSVIGW